MLSRLKHQVFTHAAPAVAPIIFRTILLTLAFVTFAHAAEPCDDLLARPRLTYDELMRAIQTSPRTFSPKHLVTFTTEGLPELQRIARENDISIFEVLGDVRAALALLLDDIKSLVKQNEVLALRYGLGHLKDLDALVGRTKFKAAHHLKLNTVLYALDILRLEMAKTEARRGGSCAYGPKELMGREGVRHLLAAVEDGRLTDTLVGLARHRARWERWLEHRWLLKNVKAAPAPVAGPTPAAEEPPGVESVDAEVARRAPPEIDAAAPETSLAAVLAGGAALRPDVDYEAETARGTKLIVSLAPHVLKQHDDGESAVVRRLLKSILVGRAHAGIKMLPTTGPNIIEVKAILHGHKRILGCLEGRRVRLLYVVDIKADVGTYARRIPANLCAP